MQHHSCHLVFWFIALSGRCLQKVGLWTKPPAFLGSFEISGLKRREMPTEDNEDHPLHASHCTPVI
jgi:hypothetical protein